MLRHLRHEEEVMLFGNVIEISQPEETEVVNYLEAEYERESLDYPYSPPPFSREAALWAAKTIYLAAQLILYRESKVTQVRELLCHYPMEMDASAILSADLCLRFLPDIISQLSVIDPDDGLILHLLELLTAWHYSGVRYPLHPQKINPNEAYADRCLKQLYTDRIIKHTRLPLATHPFFTVSVSASLGMFAADLWKDFKPEHINE
ncbi:hypothetical protein [Mucilaginibacter sp. CSA2-8R]|uniref:hypothetical protein n=1 Tax=Mucilaginibacter sp. CSA2-8R TaxID=3141542 RepID=UPI00315C61EB